MMYCRSKSCFASEGIADDFKERFPSFFLNNGGVPEITSIGVIITSRSMMFLVHEHFRPAVPHGTANTPGDLLSGFPWQQKS
jgi:hypothetical protein